MTIDFFKEKAKPPFYYQLLLSSFKTEYEIFQMLKNLFFIGICDHFNISLFDLHKINIEHIKIISQYLLSLGIKVYYKTYNYEQLHQLYENCLKDIEHIENIEIIVSTDYKTKFIQKVKITNNILDDNKINQYHNILKKHFILNFFEKWYNPNKLHDYYIPIEIIKYKTKEKRQCSIIYFDYYNDYSYLDYK